MSGGPESGTEDTIGATMAGSAPVRPRDGRLARGDALGRYVVLERLGEGGMGVVYAAYDPELDRKIAVKLLHDHGAAQDTLGRRRLLQEAQALARLNHPNIVTVHDIGEHRKRVFIAMEFVEGHTLSQWFASPRSQREIVTTFVAAGTGLAAAHAKGLIHRDFKPDNVMIGDDGRVRVMDFGLAQAAPDSEVPDIEMEITEGATGEGIDRTDRLAGTPAYMAPEQFLLEALDARCDQFSYCVALYEALFGEPPFSGNNIGELSYNVTMGKIRAPPEGSNVPSWLRRVVERGLAVDPEDRFPTMDGLLGALGRDPTRRNRTIAAALGAVVVLGGGLGWLAVDRRAAVQRCEDAGTEIWTQWMDARPEIEQAMLGTNLAYAPASFERAAGVLDGYVTALSKSETDACMATTVERSLEPESAQLSLTCLSERKANLDAMLQLFREPNAPIVRKALTAVNRLAPVEQCWDRQWLSRWTPIPADKADAAANLVEGLARVSARLETGQLRDAEEAGRPLVAQADDLDIPTLRAKARLHWGRALTRIGKHAEAEVAFAEAYHVAGRAGTDLWAAEAASDISLVIGLRLARHESGLEWAEQATMWFERLGVEQGDPRRTALTTNIGLIHQARGNYDEAEASHLQVLEAKTKALGSSHPDLAFAYNNLGILYQERGSHSKAAEHLREALERWRTSLGPVHPRVAVVHNNLGNVHKAQGDLDKAVEHHRASLAILEKALSPDHPQVGASLTNLGNVLLLQGDLEGALEHHRRALKIVEAALGSEHPRVAVILTNISAVEVELDRYDDAIQTGGRALEIKTKTVGADHPSMPELLDNLGRAHRYRAQYDEAIEFHRRAIAIREATVGADHPLTARSLSHLGIAMRKAGRFEEAITAHRRALAIRKAAAPPRPAHIATSHHELGLSLWESKDTEAAVSSLESALGLRTTVGDPVDLAESQFALARALWDAKADRKRALELATTARDGLSRTRHAERDVPEVDRWLGEHRLP